MCIQVTQTYNTCSCRKIRHLVCVRHVDYTHKQVDNTPCPDLELRAIETQEGGCDRLRRHKPCKTTNSWTFEHWTDWRFREDSWKFCEVRQPGEHACEDGSWLMGSDHTCGLGYGEFSWWRHRDPNADEGQSDEQPEETETDGNTEGEQEGESDEVDDDVDMEEGMEKLTLKDVDMEGSEEASDAEQQRAVKVKLENADSD